MTGGKVLVTTPPNHHLIKSRIATANCKTITIKLRTLVMSSITNTFGKGSPSLGSYGILQTFYRTADGISFKFEDPLLKDFFAVLKYKSAS